MHNFGVPKISIGWVKTAVLAAAAVALTACTSPTDADERPFALTTFTVIADMTRAVAGDHVRVESITKPGAEVHGYEPTPSDLRNAADADLVLDNGLGLERWFEQFLEDADASHVVLSDGIEPVYITGDSYAGQTNPHAWMSPLTAQIYVDNIAAALSDLAPEHADDFAANASTYKAELAALHDELIAGVSALPEEQRALVTCEGAFSYLARDAGLREAFLWPVNADQQGTPQQVARTVDFVRENRVPAVFCESTVSDKAQQQVAADTGARFGGTLYVDSLSGPDGPVPTYLDLLRHDISTITAGLTR